MDNFTLEINDFGKINEASIEINKINVVGGVNASGKSTASKLLYCFLKSISLKRNDYIYSKVISDLNYLIKYADNPNCDFEELPDRINIDEDFEVILREYEKYEDKFNKILESTDDFQVENIKIKFINRMIKALNEDNNVLSSYIVSSLLSDESVRTFVNIDENSGTHVLRGHVKFYSDSYESLIHNDAVKYTVEKVGEKYNITKEFVLDYDWDDDEFYYLTKGMAERIPDVFYIGAISLFDLDNYINSYQIDKKPIFGYEEHITHLINNLNNNESDIWVNEDLILFNEKISDLIKGNFHNNGLYNFSFYSYGASHIQTVNTSSGIKQIGILQLLLKNNKFKPDVFLIIDEPEVNLHPNWQFDFAEILVLLVKEYDLKLYINSHSPFFIEAIDAFTEYYDMQEDINYYLTEESEVKGKYNFTKIGSGELYKIYDNLGNAYDLINQLRLRKKLNK